MLSCPWKQVVCSDRDSSLSCFVCQEAEVTAIRLLSGGLAHTRLNWSFNVVRKGNSREPKLSVRLHVPKFTAIRLWL